MPPGVRKRTRRTNPAYSRNIMSYFSRPTGEGRISPPPVKKARVDHLPPPLPPSLPSPSPSPLSPPVSSPLSTSFPLPAPLHPPSKPTSSLCSTSIIPPPLHLSTPDSPPPTPTFPISITLPLAPPSSSTRLPPTPSPITPPLSPSPLVSFNVMDDLENILLLRSLPYLPKGATHSDDTVKLFSRNQTCLADSFLNQIAHMGLTRERLGRLLDHLLMSVSAARMPSADIMAQLWNITTDLKVLIQTLDIGTVMEVMSLFHTVLSLHPPGRSHTAHQQYRQFIQQLGEGGERCVFGAWLHIRHLLSAPYYKYFHRHVSFLVDLLLSDFWSHLTSSQDGSPMFVSIFWSASSPANSLSLPVRQLMDNIHCLLNSYAGTEVELSLLQSCMSLLFLVTTRCPDITVELTQLSRKLTKDCFLLLTSLLYPLELHAPLLASRLLPSHPTPTSREGPLPPPQALPPLPNIDTLKITAHQSSAKCPIIKLHRTQFTPGVPTLISHQAHPTHTTITSHQAHPTHTILTSHQAHPTHTTPTSHHPHPTHTTLTSHQPHPTHTLDTSIPLKTQNIKSLSLNKASKHQVVWHSPTKKRVKLSCENCDAGTTTCRRCQSLAK